MYRIYIFKSSIQWFSFLIASCLKIKSNISSFREKKIEENINHLCISILDKSAIDQLFKEAAERVREDAAVNVTSQGQINFSVWVTFVEIYNEYIYDLLEPIPKKKTARRTTLTLREDKHGIPYVKGKLEKEPYTHSRPV